MEAGPLRNTGLTLADKKNQHSNRINYQASDFDPYDTEFYFY